MYSCLIVALFAALSFVVYASPLPCDDPTPTAHPVTTSSSSAATHSPTALAPVRLSAPVVDDASNGPFTGGIATYFYQGGNPGACGWYSSDSDMICAMDQARFGTSGPSSPLCGRQVQITNLNNNARVTVTIADDCPTCQNQNSIDLSVGAFQALGDDLSVGEFPISWEYV